MIPRIEQLEPRLNPSAPEVYVWNDNLYVDGSDGRDTIVVVQLEEQVVVFVNDDEPVEFDRADFQPRFYPEFGVQLGGAVIVSGLGGNDVLIAIGDGPVSLYGDEGRDVLIGGDGADAIFGGPGNDFLYGGAGDDWIFGDSGNDRLYGQAGDDKLLGMAGKDRLFGGSGADTFAVSRDDCRIDFDSGLDRKFGDEHSLADVGSTPDY